MALKRLLFLVAILIPGALAYGQQFSFAPKWGKTILFPTIKGDIRVPIASNGSFSKNGMPVFEQHVYGNVSQINVVDVEYINVDSISDLLDNSSIQFIPYFDKNVRWTIIQIPLLKYESGSWQKLIKATYTYQSSPETFQPTNKQQTNTNAALNGFQARVGSVTGSVLSSGDWYKLSVTTDGIYKIDYTYLQNLGINPADVDPSTFQIYGNGGGMLPQANTAARPEDLLENAIQLVDDGDNVWEPNEYALFYGQGPHVWKYNGSNSYSYDQHLYADANFYYLTFNQTSGKRIPTLAAAGAASQTYTAYAYRTAIENELTNILYSGREWYGDQFNQFNAFKSFTFYIPSPDPSASTTITSNVLSRSTVTTTMTYSWNGNSLGTQTLSIMPTYDHHPEGVLSKVNYPITNTLLNSSGTNTLQLSFDKGSSNVSLANLDYIEVNTTCLLNFNSTSLFFRVPDSENISIAGYTINNTVGTESVWEITDPSNVKKLSYNFTGNTIDFTQTTNSEIKEYVILNGSSFPGPNYVGRVNNQNLHGIESPSIPDMVIITHPDFQFQAQQLANHRMNHNGFDVLIVSPETIYNEFSSGKQDICAIRDFIRMLYGRSTTTDSIKYVLLFGDGSYDPKNRISNNTNFVPLYYSYESLMPLESYSSDDFIGLLDDSDGEWTENPAVPEYMDVGVGRLPVRSANDAAIIVQKIINYETSTSGLGDWRNKATFIADDGDNNLHLTDAEAVSDLCAQYNPIININKIYLDVYPQESTPGGETAKLVEEAINRSIEDGALITNYSGHGGVLGLTQEGVVSTNSINNWNNYDRLTFMITATCDFGRFDDPARYSGAEQTLLSEKGGACGVYTSTRTVFQFSNIILNAAIYKNIFSVDDNGKHLLLGESFKRTKNGSTVGVYNRNYSLLADPAMSLAFPKETLVLTKINNNPIGSVNDTLKALSKITLEGEIRDVNSQLLSSYSGEVNITVYDKPSIITTLGNGGSLVTNFNLQNNYIFIGKASVSAGIFKVTFVVPKDISYDYAKGKVSTYAQPTSFVDDGAGYNNDLVVGGSNPNAPADNTPPIAKLYMNDASFVFGGTTGTSPTFIADVSDENGINVSGSGVGHEITLQMTGNTEIIILNKYYTSNLNDYTSGKVKYGFSQLAPGTYTLRFKVWDTYNNSTEEVLEFTVVNPEKVSIQHVLNYPNPFTTNTDFHFDHNKAGDNLQVQVQVFTVAGTLVKTLDEVFYNAPSHISGLNWNGLDDFGDKIGRGVYVYKIKVRSMTDGSTAQVYQKLVLLN
ncbi:MAG: type IX secretion system sortase PorU [Cytophagaceae bacterium]